MSSTSSEEVEVALQQTLPQLVESAEPSTPQLLATTNQVEHTTTRLHREPPSWNPEEAHQYPFSAWQKDMRAWSHTTDLDEQQQVAAICMCLKGTAQEVVRQINTTEIWFDNTVESERPNPVSYILTVLATRFATLEAP